ncbi:MAG TPA: energy transducer TonB [Bryobacteraceae bacterium]|jgi:TonB family protein
MTKHLTSDELASLIIEERGASSKSRTEHAQACASCGAELAQLESALGEFRGGMRNWSGQAFRQREFVRQLDGGFATSAWKAGLSSLLINGTMLAMIVYVGTLKPVQIAVQQAVTLMAPKLEPFKPENKGGGGGGARQPLEAKKADLPKTAPRQFTPPRVDPVQSRLQMEPTIIADMPVLASTNVGDIKGLNFPSNGPGNGGGIGAGCCAGIGPGNGPGAGDGTKGGIGGEAYRPGTKGVIGPILLHKVEPQYSDDARKAKWQGTVRLQLVVDTNGKPTSIQIVTPLGLGLDTKAIEAVEQWLFKPGTKDGKAVPVIAVVDVSFRLL